jgi:hypothetical protein
MTHGLVRLWLRLEGFAALIVSAWLYAQSESGWALFAILFLAPDLSLAAYLAGSRAGAGVYNVAHSYVLPLVLVLLEIIGIPDLTPFALIWIAHISFDRLVGFGLKYPTGAGETHLGRIGRPRLASGPA